MGLTATWRPAIRHGLMQGQQNIISWCICKELIFFAAPLAAGTTLVIQSIKCLQCALVMW